MQKNELKAELNDKQRLYKDIFLKAKDALVLKLNSISDKKEKLNFLQNIVSKDILRKINSIRLKSTEIKCARCGACCRVATSEFSYEELLEKAKNDDIFAKSFTSVFIPHKDMEIPKKEFGDYVELLKEKGLLEDVNFYHCPKLKKDEKDCFNCGDYENRPLVCRDFPNNPLVVLPPKCSYKIWKDEFEIEALFLNAMIELVGYFVQELNTQPDTAQ